MLVRREAAEQVGYLDPAFFVYSDETDFQKRLGDAGWEILFVPDALAVHHEQLTFDRSAGERRVVEFHRNRDLYMRKHHGAAAALAVRLLTAWNYAVRTVVAAVVPGQEPALVLAACAQGAAPLRAGDPRGGRGVQPATRPGRGGRGGIPVSDSGGECRLASLVRELLL